MKKSIILGSTTTGRLLLGRGGLKIEGVRLGGPLRESEVKFLTGPAFRRRGLLAVQRGFLLGATTNVLLGLFLTRVGLGRVPR